MKFLACDGDWQLVNNSPSCTGTLVAIAPDEIPTPGMNAEDTSELIGSILVLFALVFGALAVKKAVS